MKLFKHRTAVCLLVLGSLIPLTFAGSVVAAGPPALDLRTADSYAVLAGDTITNSGVTTLTGDLGLHPGTAVTGAPTVIGASNVNNGAALQAKTDLRIAYLDAEGRVGALPVVAGALGGLILSPGLYTDDGAPASLGIASGTTLRLQGDASSVWIFQSASTLIAETNSRVELAGGALACNVFWQVGSSATLRTGSVFVGTVLAHTSITLESSVTVTGRLLAGAQANGAGALTLNADSITKTHCLTAAEVAAAAAAAQAAADAAAAAAAAQAAADAAAAAAAAAAPAPGAAPTAGTPAEAATAATPAATATPAKPAATPTPVTAAPTPTTAPTVAAPKPAVKKVAAPKKPAIPRQAAPPSRAGGDTSVRGPALPPRNPVGFTG